MDEYAGLKYRTYHDVPVKREYSKIYFCASDQDYENYFENISKEVWDVKKTIVFWHKNFDEDYDENGGDEEAFFSALEQMQLFVIPVTYEFLYTDNFERRVELPFAMEHKIPVLPLLQDTSLAAEFNRKCRSLQALDKSLTDPTAIAYGLKLKKFLEAVLVSDELTEKIKNAFEGYLFLSYRKKDRRLAQKVMKKIHENEYCRDVAIWYDEYIKPGENFNDVILEALQKSQLFVLVVTPQILEVPNYVMKEEYPMAWKYNKKILPVVAEKTEKVRLKEYYAYLPESIDLEDTYKLSDTLWKLLRGNLTKKESTSDHLYYMGLAYLSGIDVEINSSRAIDLLEQAAEKINISAMEKLVEVYRYGIGAEADLQKAITWQKKIVNLTLAAYQFKKTEHTCKWYVDSLNTILELYEEKKESGNIRKSIQLICDFIENEAIHFNDLDLYMVEIDMYLKLLRIASEEENIEEYIYYFPKYESIMENCAEEISKIDRKKARKETLLKEFELKYTKEKYADDTVDVKLAELRLEQAKREEKRVYERYREMQRRVFLYEAEWVRTALWIGNDEAAQKRITWVTQNIGALEAEKDTVIVAEIFCLAAETSVRNGDNEGAKAYLNKSIAVCKNTMEQQNTKIVKLLCRSYELSEVIYAWEKDIHAEDTILTERLQLCLESARKTKSVGAMLACIKAYEDFGKAERDWGNLEKGKEYFLKAHEIAEMLYKNYKEAWAIEEAATSFFLLEDIAKLQKNEEEEKFYHEEMMKLDLEQACMNLYLESRDGKNELFRKLLKLGERLGELLNTTYLVEWLVKSYNRMGEEEKSEEWFVETIETMIKAAETLKNREGFQILASLRKELADILERRDG